MLDIYSELETYVLENLQPNAFKESRKFAMEAEIQFLAQLSPDQNAVYEKFRTTELHYNCEYDSAIFRAGFRLGAQLMCDVLHKPAKVGVAVISTRQRLAYK